MLQSPSGPRRAFKGKCHHCGIIGHMKRDCRKLEAGKKSQQEVANLAQGEDDNNDRATQEDTDDECIDELCFLMELQHIQGSDQSLDGRPCIKQVTFDDHKNVTMFSQETILGKAPEDVQVVGRPTKRCETESSQTKRFIGKRSMDDPLRVDA